MPRSRGCLCARAFGLCLGAPAVVLMVCARVDAAAIHHRGAEAAAIHHRGTEAAAIYTEGAAHHIDLTASDVTAFKEWSRYLLKGPTVWSEAGHPPGEPVLHRGVNVFVFGTDAKGSCIHFRQGGAQAGSDAAVFRRREQLRCAETLDVTQAAEDIPGEQPGIPQPVFDRGVIEQLPVQRGRRDPQCSWRAGGAPGALSHARYDSARCR